MKLSVLELSNTPSRAVQAKDERKLLSLGLRRIPLDLQICLELHYWEGLPGVEIARVLELDPTTVRTRSSIRNPSARPGPR